MTDKNDGEAAVLEKVDEWDDPYVDMGRRLHHLIMRTVDAQPRTWYGMPGYAKTKSSPVICFFRVDDYMTFGITEKANLAAAGDETLIPSAWFLTGLDAATETRIADIVTNAFE